MAIIDNARINSILLGYNPWWSGVVSAVPGFYRAGFRHCLEKLIDPENRRAIMLIGPRRVGKSTILRQVAHRLIAQGVERRSVLYVSLDDNILKLVGLRDILDSYHRGMHPEGQKTVLLLDEIHYTKDWDTELKRLVDHFPNYRILATGSAALEQRHGAISSGVGRWTTVSIPTLSFFEFVSIRGWPVPEAVLGVQISELRSISASARVELAAALRLLLPEFRRYLLVGGFPETARMEDVREAQRRIREDIVGLVLKRDVPTLFGVRNAADLERVFIYLCLHSGGIVNVSTLASELGTSRATVDAYLEALVGAQLVYRVSPFESGGKKVLKARHKYYLCDAGIRNAVLLQDDAALNDAAEAGLVVETAVLRHLYAYYYRDMPKISYWQQVGTQREVDVILSTPRWTVPFEVKYRDRPGDAEGLRAFCGENPVERAYLITMRDTDFGPSDAVPATTLTQVPAHVFTYLIGQAETV